MNAVTVNPAAWRVAALTALTAAACHGMINDGGGAGKTTGDSSGGADGGVGACDADALGTQNVRRLSHVEYNRTVADLFPTLAVERQEFAPDLPIHGFENAASSLNPSPILISAYSRAARSIAELAVANRDAFMPCSESTMACARTFITDFGKRTFRRPLETAEVEAYESYFADQMAQISFNAALELTLSAMLQAPPFLYRLEFGAPGAQADASDAVPLSDYEMASRMSYFLWQSMPDDPLLAAAEAGKLNTPEQIAGEALRMLDDPRAEAAIVDFHRQWLGLDDVMIQNKDPQLFPEWNDSVRSNLREEADRFIAFVYSRGEGTVQALLTSNETFVNAELATFYGLPPPATEWEQVSLPEEQRAGIFTQGAFLSAKAHSTNGSPPLRGVAILDRLLCAPPPAPPANADTSNPNDGTQPRTNRELFDQRAAPPTCQACHVQINGIGSGFEHYDATGRYRDVDNGFPVDASGMLVGTDSDGPFDGARELMERLADSEQVQACVVQNWFRYAHGRNDEQADDCKQQPLRESFLSSGGDVRALIQNIVTSREFMYRPRVAAE